MAAILLGGRAFVPATVSTWEHDIYFQSLLRKAGLERLKAFEGERADEFAVRLHDRLMTPDCATPVAGCLLFPADMDPLNWTPAVAKDVQAHIGRLTDPAEKAAVSEAVSRALIDFFERGLTCSTAFATSFLREQEQARAAKKMSPNRGRGARGPRPFDTWRTAISTVLASLFAGRFPRRSTPSASG